MCSAAQPTTRLLSALRSEIAEIVSMSILNKTGWLTFRGVHIHIFAQPCACRTLAHHVSRPQRRIPDAYPLLSDASSIVIGRIRVLPSNTTCRASRLVYAVAKDCSIDDLGMHSWNRIPCRLQLAIAVLLALQGKATCTPMDMPAGFIEQHSCDQQAFVNVDELLPIFLEYKHLVAG